LKFMAGASCGFYGRCRNLDYTLPGKLDSG
jgi:hypothetical protein